MTVNNSLEGTRSQCLLHNPSIRDLCFTYTLSSFKKESFNSNNCLMCFFECSYHSFLSYSDGCGILYKGKNDVR